MDSTHDPLAVSRARRRPRSRGSTASIHSATTQPNLEHPFPDGSEPYPQQWVGHDQSHRDLVAAPNRMTPEDLLLASQLQESRDFSLHGSLDASMNSVASFNLHPNHTISRHSMSADSFAGNTSFADDSQMMDRDANEDNESFVGAPGHTKSGSRTSANNEIEMRQLFSVNKHRALKEVAQELHGNERGPNSERTRQVFAMLWINQVCSKGKGSVPRGRVYANYASRCATERITVLNPASFGKLVRVLFPGLKTRRLGVRGESKYHYVNFALTEEQPEVGESTPQPAPAVPLGEGMSQFQNFNTLPVSSTNIRSEHAALPTPDIGQQQEPTMKRSHEFQHSLYNQPRVSTVEQLNTTMTKTAQRLCFLAEPIEQFQQADALILPPIEPFLPSGTDPDAAKSLVALYRSHCTSLVDSIRFCKEKTFFHLFTSFQGTLTMPVQRLFTNPAVAPWIEECDFILYQRMMRIVSSLTLQVVPKPVIDTLRGMSEKLVPHIRESFRGLPHHVIGAKEAPATLFAGFLDRALRVNLTAHAAANMLSNPANRDLMYEEWMTMINVRKIAESVPSRAMDDTVNLLLREMRDLLNPANIDWNLACSTLQGDMVLRDGRQPREQVREGESASNVLDPWVNFLRSLPNRFPYASHTDIVWSVQRLGTAVMREFTIAQGNSFGSWWVTKCWIDEMIQFLAEQGGFMKQKSTQDTLLIPKHQSAKKDMSNPGSRYSSASEDFHVSHMSEPQPDRAPFPSVPPASNQQSHDDSGIGIRTPDEEQPPGEEKFAFTPPTGQHMFTSAELDM